jgi:hypothetical protein
VRIDYPECEELLIDGYRLILTSVACPEQYDVFNSQNEQVGYLRLRGGAFRADCPTCGGATVYESRTSGDGIFDSGERLPQITAAVAAIKSYWENLQ